jgi:hypothetical protein
MPTSIGGAFVPGSDYDRTGATDTGLALSTLKSGFSTATVATAYAADTYIAGTGIAVPAGGWVAGTRYQAVFDMVKTAAGTATPIVVVRVGTLGTVADTAVLTFTFAAGTAAVDTGTFCVTVVFRTVGAGTAAVVAGTCEIRHALAATGLTATGAAGNAQLAVVSSGFNSATGTRIGVSFNGGTSFSGTNTVAFAELRGY